MAGRGHPIQGREYPRALRGDSFRGLVKHPLFWCAVVGSMIVAVNIILLRKYHHVKKPSPIVTVGTMGTAHDVSKYGVGESGFYKTTDRPGGERNPGLVAPGALVIPPAWDSTLCMEHWERPELLTEPDPNGYVVFVNGAEQLGGNKYLFADGIFIAKMLDRTLVEFPVKDARISAANSTIGLGAYWDLLDMCM